MITNSSHQPIHYPDIKIPITTLEHLIQDISLKNWNTYDIHWLEHILSGGMPSPPETLITKYRLLCTTFFTLYCIYHFLAAFPPSIVGLNFKIWQYYSNPLKSMKRISLIYNLLQDKRKFTKAKPMLQWESNLQVSFSDSQWIQAIRYSYSITHCVNHWELALKVSLRWYLNPCTPLVLQQYS